MVEMEEGKTCSKGPQVRLEPGLALCSLVAYGHLLTLWATLAPLVHLSNLLTSTRSLLLQPHAKEANFQELDDVTFLC